MGAIKAAIEAIILLDQIGVALGLGGFGALLAGLWASMSSLPPVLIVLSAGMGFAIAILCFNGIRAYLRNRGTVPNYEDWDAINELSLNQVARLWCERNPLSPQNQRSYTLFRMFKEQARQGKLAIESPSLVSVATGEVRGNDMVTRQELEKFAISRGERPKFLFKDAR